MARRQRTGGVTAGRQRQLDRPVYEDFQPETETNEEEEARFVILHVPGFQKEQMKITSEQGNNIRVHGQRPLSDDNRWSRFNLLLPIPQNCDMNKIHAKFFNGKLTLTMPKDVPKKTSMTTPKPKEEPAQKTQENKTTSIVAPQEEKPAEKTTQENINDTIPPKTESTKVAPPLDSEPNQKAAAAAELRAQKGQENTLPTAARDEGQKDARNGVAEKISQKTGSAELKEEKSQQGSSPTVTWIADKDEKTRDKKKIVELMGQRGYQEETLRKQREIDAEKRVVALADPHKRTSELKSQKGQEETEKLAEGRLEKEKESSQKGKEMSGAPAAVVDASKILDEGKEAIERLLSGAADKEQPKKEDGNSTEGNQLGVKSITETAKETMTNAVKRLGDEDNQLFMNIGAVILALVALGAYATYRLVSSAKRAD